MERLTDRSNIGWWLSELKDESGEYDDCPMCCEKQHGCDCCRNCPIQKAVDKLAYYENLEEQGYEMVNINNIIAKLESHFMAEENILNMGGYLDAIKIVKDEVENGKTD